MECKFLLSSFIPAKILELIDTLWNVNFSTISGLKVLPIELIDTLWNVNYQAGSLY